MKEKFKKILLWIYIKLHMIMIYISIALRNTEVNLLKANPDDLNEKNKKITRKINHNKLLEKFYAGQTDEKYVKDYYEILKKADKFIKNATPFKIALAGDENGMSYGKKDRYGRRYEHYGFFDDKHKHVGKTLGEVLELEIEERRTDDDDYVLLYIFNNKPIEVGLSKIDDVVDSNGETLILKDLEKKSKVFDFPIKVVRNDESIINKIEQLTEFLHIKSRGFDKRQLEFFIPKKFKTAELHGNSSIFKELKSIDEVYIKNEYGEIIGFKIEDYIKRIEFGNYEVLKFYGSEMETIIK